MAIRQPSESGVRGSGREEQIHTKKERLSENQQHVTSAWTCEGIPFTNIITADGTNGMSSRAGYDLPERGPARPNTRANKNNGLITRKVAGGITPVKELRLKELRQGVIT